MTAITARSVVAECDAVARELDCRIFPVADLEHQRIPPRIYAHEDPAFLLWWQPGQPTEAQLEFARLVSYALGTWGAGDANDLRVFLTAGVRNGTKGILPLAVDRMLWWHHEVPNTVSRDWEIAPGSRLDGVDRPGVERQALPEKGEG